MLPFRRVLRCFQAENQVAEIVMVNGGLLCTAFGPVRECIESEFEMVSLPLNVLTASVDERMCDVGVSAHEIFALVENCRALEMEIKVFATMQYKRTRPDICPSCLFLSRHCSTAPLPA